MRVPFECALLGKPLKTEKVFMYCDCPRLLSLSAPGGLFLATHVDDIEEVGADGGEVGGWCWLIVGVSKERMALIESGVIDLRDAFRLAGEAIWIEAVWRSEGNRLEKVLDPKSLDDDLFCEAGVHLGGTGDKAIA